MAKNLICVDIHPIYRHVITFDMYDFVEFLNSFKGDVLYLYTEPDRKEDIIDWLMEFAFDVLEDSEDFYHKISSCFFYKKEIGYFRDIMDAGVLDEDQIIDLINYMWKTKVCDVRKVDKEVLINIGIDKDLNIGNDYSFWVDDELLDILKSYNNALIVGGAEDECIREITYMLEALGNNYKLKFNLIY